MMIEIPLKDKMPVHAQIEKTFVFCDNSFAPRVTSKMPHSIDFVVDASIFKKVIIGERIYVRALKNFSPSKSSLVK